jgi:anamorsin
MTPNLSSSPLEKRVEWSEPKAHGSDRWQDGSSNPKPNKIPFHCSKTIAASLIFILRSPSPLHPVFTMFSICLHIGTATSSDASAFTTILNASTATEIANLRSEIAPASVDALLMVVSAEDLAKPDVFNPMELANWLSILTAAAAVAIQVVGTCSDLQPVHTSFLLAGLSMASERKTSDGSRVLTAKRKSTVTSSMPLKKVILSVEEDEEDMINEDDLLNDTVLAPPPAMGARTAGDDCDGRKPCDNCTCGRADEVARSEEKKVATSAPSSSCGKCSLGDAFRCASCPYLGKPAFKAGEEHLILDLADDL